MSRHRIVRDAEEAEDLAALMQRHGVTHLQCTPSMARALVADAAGRAAVGGLKELLVGGEALPADLATMLAREVKGAVRNMYGPTETTVWSTTARVTPDGAPTIGKPIANTVIRIVDARGELAPPGVAGEILIGGEGVGRGYFGREDLTSERFIADRWGSGRVYRTGDLGRYRADGEIEFLGRLDHQVKVNGYRIELGEIESTLGRHPAVKQGVVVAHASGGSGSELVAYVVPAERSSHDGHGRVAEWQAIWDHAYRHGNDTPADPRFRIGGWTNSYTGEPVPADEMREWIDETVARIRSLNPKRVVEIGCGTGMILYRMLPHVEHYTGMDISPAALDGIRAELTEAEARRVTLIEAPAHAIDGVPDRPVDLVIINSVAQYFPDRQYLETVLAKAAALVADGGHIFVGDVRSLPHLEAFHTAVALHRAPKIAVAAEVRSLVDASVARENELLVADGFFDKLAASLERISGVRVHLKQARAANEMTVFRYDVVLDVGRGESATLSAPAGSSAESLDAVRRMIASGPDVIHLADVLNARLTGIASAIRKLQEQAPVMAGELLREVGFGSGIDPAALATLSPDYEVEIRWASSGDPWRFDALLRHKARGKAGRWARPGRVRAPAASPVTNVPARATTDKASSDSLRDYLRDSLPEYMVPSTFMWLEAFPLTPNGKIDRKALPKPRAAMPVDRASYVAPASDIEEQIAGVWRQVLGVDRVGRTDNIFDIGANSLITMQANARLSELLGRKVSLVSMFRFPTVESLARHLAPASEQENADDRRARERAQRAESAAERRRALRKER
jgi:SAM-dependent methyltransferase